LLSLIAFPFGLIIGSFLNVVIHRVPRGESVVTPRSHCPHCNHPIAWYENVPLLSYLALRGRCRECRAPISPRYLLVELLTGLMFAGLAAVFAFEPPFFKYALFASMIIALMFIDLHERLLPDVITFPGMAAGLVLALFVPVEDGGARFLLAVAGLRGAPGPLVSLSEALLGGAVGAGVLWLVAELYFRLRRREGLGFGDVKLMALVGIFLGMKSALLTIFLGSLAGSVIGGSYMLVHRKGTQYELPFGTFLGMMALFAMVWGREIVDWYLALSR